ncbi:hypothetical protein BDY19DRAFT_995235 [Irpex rosettiformis]|uniref:Uncharacterized protein n=1 Tax=Irpex rosettiformis TaxID=378272 RepID=A0ACB8TYK9_9APHY|nr:hypothetical protein BDY19DRAFT_995235 [Irpex rosettiformis]
MPVIRGSSRSSSSCRASAVCSTPYFNPSISQTARSKSVPASENRTYMLTSPAHPYRGLSVEGVGIRKYRNTMFGGLEGGSNAYPEQGETEHQSPEQDARQVIQRSPTSTPPLSYPFTSSAIFPLSYPKRTRKPPLYTSPHVSDAHANSYASRDRVQTLSSVTTASTAAIGWPSQQALGNDIPSINHFYAASHPVPLSPPPFVSSAPRAGLLPHPVEAFDSPGPRLGLSSYPDYLPPPLPLRLKSKTFGLLPPRHDSPEARYEPELLDIFDWELYAGEPKVIPSPRAPTSSHTLKENLELFYTHGRGIFVFDRPMSQDAVNAAEVVVEALLPAYLKDRAKSELQTFVGRKDRQKALTKLKTLESCDVALRAT